MREISSTPPLLIFYLFFFLQTAHHLANSQRSRFPTQPSHRSPRLETSKPVGVAGRYSQVDGFWPGKDIRVLHVAHHRGKCTGSINPQSKQRTLDRNIYLIIVLRWTPGRCLLKIEVLYRRGVGSWIRLSGTVNNCTICLLVT